MGGHGGQVVSQLAVHLVDRRDVAEDDLNVRRLQERPAYLIGPLQWLLKQLKTKQGGVIGIASLGSTVTKASPHCFIKVQ